MGAFAASQHLPECAILAPLASADRGVQGEVHVQKHAASYAQIRENPRFQALVGKRNRYAFALSALIVCAYFSYILLIAFRPDWMARPLAAGMTINLGIPFGLGIIVLTVLLTALYVRRANREFDQEAAEIRRQVLK